MLNRTMCRMAVATAAAGTVCVLGAASASAVPASSWSGPATVPGASTNTSPALAEVSVTNAVHGTLVAWKGQFNNKVHYRVHTSKWLKTEVIPGASTNTGPAVGGYRDGNGRNAVLAVWRKAGTSKIYYATGESAGNGSFNWTKPGLLISNSGSGPSLIFPDHAPHGRVIVAYRGPFDHVRYAVGTPVGRRFKWSPNNWIGGGSSTETAGTPQLGETPGAKAGTGTVYVVFEGNKSHQVRYATTPDPLNFNGRSLTWSSVSVVPGAATDASPAASSEGIRDSGPLMIAYKAPHVLGVDYVTLTGGVWSAPASTGADTAVGPALLFDTLGTASDNSSGSIQLRIFS
jgi:hypothetical protein